MANVTEQLLNAINLLTEAVSKNNLILERPALLNGTTSQMDLHSQESQPYTKVLAQRVVKRVQEYSYTSWNTHKAGTRNREICLTMNKNGVVPESWFSKGEHVPEFKGKSDSQISEILDTMVKEGYMIRFKGEEIGYHIKRKIVNDPGAVFYKTNVKDSKFVNQRLRGQ